MDIQDQGQRCCMCNRRAHWAKKPDRPPKYCWAHKKSDSYVIVTGMGCKYPGCDRIAFYGPPGIDERQWCRQHASEEDGDLLHTYCSYPDCWVRTKSTYCSEHNKAVWVIEKLDE